MKLQLAAAVAALTLFGLSGTEQAVAAPHSAALKTAACRFIPPAGMEPGTQSWLGACVVRPPDWGGSIQPHETSSGRQRSPETPVGG